MLRALYSKNPGEKDKMLGCQSIVESRIPLISKQRHYKLSVLICFFSSKKSLVMTEDSWSVVGSGGQLCHDVNPGEIQTDDEVMFKRLNL